MHKIYSPAANTPNYSRFGSANMKNKESVGMLRAFGSLPNRYEGVADIIAVAKQMRSESNSPRRGPCPRDFVS